jgi:hypothetical protein
MPNYADLYDRALRQIKIQSVFAAARWDALNEVHFACVPRNNLGNPT